MIKQDIHALAAKLQAMGATALVADSRKLQAGQVFVAWPGYGLDARQFVVSALAAGASACVIEAEGAQNWGFQDARIFSVHGLKARAGELAAAFYDQPTAKLKLCAITGTNGKTSSSWWLAQAIEQLPAKYGLGGCGLVGTLGVGRMGALAYTGLTTPDPITLQAQLAQMHRDGCGACAMEASSIGLVEGRMAGSQIHTAVFTNFTQDHLDYHGDMASYWKAKLSLFDWPGLRAAVVNLDDVKGLELLVHCRDRGLACYSYSVVRPADVYAENISFSNAGARFTLRIAGQAYAMALPLYGAYNISNVLGVIATLLSLGVAAGDAVVACSQLRAVPGRMEVLQYAGWPTAVVDYAHTPDALEKSLQALQTITQAAGAKLWVVFGCGGNRDGSKRPLMGAAAQQNADIVVLTSDNPRDEDPAAIAQAVLAGMQKMPVRVELDRAAAIAWALDQAAPQDVVLIAGKGHEDYQEVRGQKTHFSDQEEVRKMWSKNARQDNPVELMNLGQVHTWLEQAGIPARLIGHAATPILRVHTDTRSVQAGDLFIALKGEKFDAGSMLPQAKIAGATAAITQTSGALQAAGLPGIEVENSLRALGALAAAWRAQFALPLIAVTGSNGKTTVTQMIAGILRVYAGDAALATQGNLNNEIGVPLTLLRLRASHRIGVVELGMNHPGEIDYLASLTKPQVAIVNNAQREHQEFMHTVEAVARENGSVLLHLPVDGTAVYPADDAYASVWQSQTGGREVLRFAAQGAAELTAQADWREGAWIVRAHSPLGEFAYRLRIAGRHHVKNSLAAVAACLAVGIPVATIAQGLNAFEAVPGRCRVLRLCFGGKNLDVVDDSYNANPDSVCAAVDVLADLPGPHLLVLGDMGEVGSQGEEFHTEIGEYAAERGIESLYAIGDLMRYTAAAFPGARHFASMESLQAACLREAQGYRSILIKGSRFMRMERLLKTLEEANTSHTTACVADAITEKGGAHAA